MVSLPFGEAMRRIIADRTNPPLFYGLLKGWVALGGDGDTWARLRARRHAMPAVPSAGVAAAPSEPRQSGSPDSGALVLLALSGLGAPLAVWGLTMIWGHSVWVERYLLGATAPVALLTAIDVATGSPRDVVAFEAFTAAPLQHYAAAGMSVQVVRTLESIPAGDSWVVFRPESFTNSVPAERLPTHRPP